MGALHVLWNAVQVLGLLLGSPRAPQSLEHWHPHPDSPIPYGFELETLDGSYVLEPEHGRGVPLLFHAYLHEDAALRYMWMPENSATIDAFLADLPHDVNVLFVSYGIESLAHAHMMRSALLAGLERAGLNESETNARLAAFHFAKVPMSGVSDKGANFLPNLMGQWRSSRAVVRSADLGPAERVIERLDAAYEWLPWPPPSGQLPVAPFGDGCNDPVPFNVSGSVALIVRRPGGNCSYAELLSRAQQAGAAAALVSAVPGSDVSKMSCGGGECALPLRLFGTMIPHAAAVQLQEAAAAAAAAGGETRVSFGEEAGPGYFAAVDAAGRLQEVGWVKLPSLQHLSWAGQWLAYTGELAARLAEGPALEVPVFKQQIMHGEHGVSATVQMPPAGELEKYARLELFFELGCPEDPAEQAWQAAASNDSLSVPKRNCGRELGRWITPFRRRVGAWLTDVTPLRSLVEGGASCTFTAQTAPWALPWKPSLTLRYSQRRDSGDADAEATLALLPLFTGGTFDSSYNSRRRPARLATPKGTQRALLYAVITGHGSDEHQCAEFCPTLHRVSVGNASLPIEFTQAGTLWGCTKHVRQGDVPNEHGTWQYGRAGWCDGSNVKPWVADITHLIAPPGRETEFAYEGLFNGSAPNPKGRAGYIMMESSVVYLGRARGPAAAAA